MTGLLRGSDAALAPVRGSLLAAAERAAADLGRDAGDRAQALLADARREADLIRSAATAEGAAAARSEALLRSARARREAHELVLGRRSALRLELQRQVAESAGALRTDPRYPELLARLTGRAAATLGPGAVVTESPDGGVLAEAGSRRVDLSLPTLAAEMLESMTAEVRALWTP